MLVDKVNKALQDPSSDDNCEEDDEKDDEEGSFEDDDEEMGVDDGPDDMMTLSHYQSEVRRDALIRKGSHVDEGSSKKGRILVEGSNV